MSDRPLNEHEALGFATIDLERILGNIHKRFEEIPVKEIRIQGPWVCAKGLKETFKNGYTEAERMLIAKIMESGVKRCLRLEVERDDSKWKDYIRIVAVCLN